jgi:hypothetical protein
MAGGITPGGHRYNGYDMETIDSTHTQVYQGGNYLKSKTDIYISASIIIQVF